jgi:regulator of protease activity HflC (stomatin/prohibitin superfamily)
METKIDKATEEKNAWSCSGMGTLLCLIVFTALSVFTTIWAFGGSTFGVNPGGGLLLLLPTIVLWVAIVFLSLGLRILKPNEAYAFTVFGKYYGSLKEAGFYFVNPFAVPTKLRTEDSGYTITTGGMTIWKPAKRKISLKATTLNNEKQKINDQLGNPIEIGIVVIWRVVNTAKAVFNVDDYNQFLSTQSDSALRNIVRMYPYDIHDGEEGADELSLRGSSKEIAEQIRTEIQEKVEVAGLEIMEARITHLAYSPEIAAAMLQRQQAAAIIDARALIVKGAVSMVEQALTELSEHDIVELDNERKAAMVSNLLVVLCGNKDPQPIVNSGSLY